MHKQISQQIFIREVSIVSMVHFETWQVVQQAPACHNGNSVLPVRIEKSLKYLKFGWGHYNCIRVQSNGHILGLILLSVAWGYLKALHQVALMTLSKEEAQSGKNLDFMISIIVTNNQKVRRLYPLQLGTPCGSCLNLCKYICI